MRAEAHGPSELERFTVSFAVASQPDLRTVARDGAILEDVVRAFLLGPEEGVEGEAIEQLVFGPALSVGSEPVGVHLHLGERGVGIWAVLRLVPVRLLALFVDVGPVEDLILVILAVGDRSERGARQVQVEPGLQAEICVGDDLVFVLGKVEQPLFPALVFIVQPAPRDDHDPRAAPREERHEGQPPVRTPGVSRAVDGPTHGGGIACHPRRLSRKRERERRLNAGGFRQRAERGVSR